MPHLNRFRRSLPGGLDGKPATFRFDVVHLADRTCERRDGSGVGVELAQKFWRRGRVDARLPSGWAERITTRRWRRIRDMFDTA